MKRSTASIRRMTGWVLPALLAVPRLGAAQAARTPETALPSTYRATGWSAHSHGTVVALVLRIPAGSADDQDGFEGTSALLGQVLQNQAARAFGPDQGRVAVDVGRDATTFTLLALPDAWPRAAEVLDSVVFDTPVDDSLLERLRKAQLARLAFEAGSPGTEFERAAVQLLASPGSPWARPLRGTPESVATISGLTLDLYRRSFYKRAATVRALVGPSDLLQPATTAPMAATPDSAPRPAPDTVPPLVWSTGGRTDQVRDVTSTWIRVAYPVAASTPRTAAEMLAGLIHDDLDPTPPDPDRYGVDVLLRETPGGTVLVVDATVFPDAADRWERKITETVSRLASEPLKPDFFAWRRRRFRTERLLEEAAPEAEGRRMTGDLLRSGHPRDLAVEIWGLAPEALTRAARTLGQPRVLRFGPDLGQSHGTGALAPPRATRPRAERPSNLYLDGPKRGCLPRRRFLLSCVFTFWTEPRSTL